MNLILALVTGILFGCAIYLLVQKDLVRNVVGTSLLANSVILYIIASGLTRGRAPIYPLQPGSIVSDPVVQALVLTAVVINFGATALVLSLVYRVYVTHGSIDQDTLRDAERKDVIALYEEQAGEH